MCSWKHWSFSSVNPFKQWCHTLYTSNFFFHTPLWFPASDHDFRRFGSDFQCLCEVMTKKNCGRNTIDHGRPCRTEFTLVSLYFTEITRYCLWFLEYRLTRANSAVHDGFSLSCKPSRTEEWQKNQYSGIMSLEGTQLKLTPSDDCKPLTVVSFITLLRSIL